MATPLNIEMDINGGRILLQAGEQVLSHPIIIGDGTYTPDGDIVLEGQGASTVLKRGADMQAGKGVLNVYGKNIVLRNFVIDGNVLTPNEIDVGSMSDPIADGLTANSSIWIHPGASHIRFENVVIRHTGGYAILLDSRTADITNVEVVGCTIENSRSQVITYSGVPGGGWTGGIFCKMLGTSGTSGGVNGLTISGCTFRRISGIGFWSHSNGFDFHNTNLVITGNRFEDVARDGVEPGNWQGGNITSNTFFRTGHLCADDESASVPCWPTGAPNAVAIDSTGYNRDFTVSGNSIRNTNGTGCDLDGMFSSVISNNTISVEDGVSGFGPGGIGNYSTGIQPGNTYYKLGASNLVISGNTIKGMGNTALSLSNLKDSQVTYNNIIHPSSSALAPVVLFCKPGYDSTAGFAYTSGNTDSAYRAHGNVIANNRVLFSGTHNIVEEIALAGGADYAFKAVDVNRTFHNIVTGSTPGEFKKSADSSSFAGFDLFTNDGTSTSADVTRIQREGTSTSATTKTYKIVAGTKTQLQQLSDSSFLNLSVGGAAKTGVFATGSRSTSAFADCIVTGKLCGDGFLSLTDTTLDSDANLLPDTYGLLKYDSATKTFKKSTSVSGGARVWTDFAASVAGSDKQVQFNDGGVLAGNASLTFDKASKVLTVTGSTGTAGIVASTSFIQSAEGFYTTSSSSSAINAPSGGVTSLSLISVRNDGSPGIYLSRSSSTARTYGLGVNSSGQMVLRDETANSTRLTVTTAGTFTFGSTVSIDQSGNLSASAVVSAAGVNVSGTSANSLQVASGGLTAKYLVGTTSLTLTGETSANAGLSSSGQGRLYFDSSTNKFRVSENGGSYVDLLSASGVTSITGTANQVTASASTGAITLALPQNIHTSATPTFSTLTISSSASNAISVTGSISAAGYSATGSATNQIQAASGGVSAKWLVGTTSLTLTGDSSANAGLSSSGQGRIYFDSSSNKFRVSQNGGSYVDLVGSSSQWTTSSGNIYFTGGNIFAGASADDGTGAQLQVAGYVSVSHGLYSPNSATTTVNVPAGGVTAKWLIGTTSLTLTGASSGSAGLSASGQGRLYFDSSSNKFRVSENGGSYVDLLSASGVTSIAGTSNQITASASTGAVTLSLPQNIHTGASPTFVTLNATDNVYVGNTSGDSFVTMRLDGSVNGFYIVAASASGASSGGSIILRTAATGTGDGSDRLTVGSTGLVTISGVTSQASLTVSNGYVSSAGGFTTASTNTDAIQASVGGCTAKYLIGTSSLTLTTDASAGLSTSGQARFRFNGSDVQLSLNGGSFTALATALSGGTGVSISSGVVSIGQAVSTSSTPTFASVIANGTFNSTVTGSTIGLQVNSGTFQVNGSGQISGLEVNTTQGYKVGGVASVNSSNQFVGAGINVGSNGVNAGGYNINGGYSGQTWNIGITGGGTFTINGSGAYTNIQFRGGVITGAF